MRIPLGKIARVQGRIPMPENAAHDHWYRPPDTEGAVSIKKIFGQTVTARYDRGQWRAAFRRGRGWASYESESFDSLWREIHSDLEHVAQKA